MKRTLTLAMGIVAFGAATMAQAQFFLAGNWQNPQWSNNSNAMTAMGNDHYQIVLSGLTANTTYETKVTDGTWNVTYPANNKRIFTNGAGAVTVDFWNKPTFGDGWIEDGPRIGFSTDGSMALDVIGSTADFTSWGAGLGMTNLGSGVYSRLVDVTAAGNVEFKFRKAGEWGNFEYGAGGGSDNILFNFASAGQYEMKLDLANGRYDIEAVPEPATMAVLGGIAALAALKRRKK